MAGFGRQTTTPVKLSAPSPKASSPLYRVVSKNSATCRATGEGAGVQGRLQG